MFFLLACHTGPPSIVLVSLDTLRSDRLGAYGNTDGLTPNLDKFALEATLFTQAYSQANETCFSHASMFTGRYPSELGRLDQDFRLDTTTPVAASMLAAYGYRTGASVAGGFLDPVFGFSRGFDHYDSPVQWASLYHTSPLALDWLDSIPMHEPFFLFLHGYDTHQRYLKPSPYGHAWVDPAYRGVAQSLVEELDGTLRITDGVVRPAMTLLEVQSRSDVRFRSEQARARLKLEGAMSTESLRLVGEEDEKFVRDIYDGSVAYADAMFGIFMAGLAERGLLDETVVIVMSDHGEGLGEDGLFAHRFGVEDPETHVPLLIRMPSGAGGGRRVDDLVELTDILPTLAEISGATPPASIRGRSLLPATRGQALTPKEAAFTQGAFRMVSARLPTGRFSFSGIAADSEWLDDVVEGVRLDSPGVRTTPGMTESDRVDARVHLVTWHRSLPPAPENTEITDPALKEELRARGYWGAN